MKLVADSNIPFLKGVFEPFAEVVYLPGDAINESAVRDANALIVRTRTRCDKALLAGSKVRFIATATIGHDHLFADDLAACGVAWANAPGSNASSVMQYVACALVTLAHESGVALAGKTLGVVGVGHVGSKVARLGRILGMRVLLNDPPRARSEGGEGFVALERIAREADIITLHVPLTPSGADRTHHLVDSAFCAALERSPMLINTSRGEVVDSPGLAAALAGGRISKAILDVWEHEPAIDRHLMTGAAIATPHIAGYSLDGKAAATAAAVRAVSRFFSLPLGSFMVAGLPPPPDPSICLDVYATSDEELLYQACLRSYDIRRDDAMLRSAPENFERLREAYPLRREPPAYHIKKGPPGTAWRDKLQALGFLIDRSPQP